jgi:hypothetical protein
LIVVNTSETVIGSVRMRIEALKRLSVSVAASVRSLVVARLRVSVTANESVRRIAVIFSAISVSVTVVDSLRILMEAFTIESDAANDSANNLSGPLITLSAIDADSVRSFE